MDFDDFYETYKPITNNSQTSCAPIIMEGDNAQALGFETYGDDLEKVKQADPRCVFTLVDDGDGGIQLVSGTHYVNRLAYLITEVPHEGEPLSFVYSESDHEEEGQAYSSPRP